MKRYRSHKEVLAEPMDYHSAGKKGLIRNYDKDKDNSHGYHVKYRDDYSSWSPKEAFESGYTEIDTTVAK